MIGQSQNIKKKKNYEDRQEIDLENLPLESTIFYNAYWFSKLAGEWITIAANILTENAFI